MTPSPHHPDTATSRRTRRTRSHRLTRRADRGARPRVRRDPRRGLRRPRRPRREVHPRHDRDAPAAGRDRPRRAPVRALPRACALLGTALARVAKILENMEIGHNVMHGQWDWMNDPGHQLLDVGLGLGLDRRGVEALPQLRPPHLHEHPRQGPRPRLRDHADRPAPEVASGLPPPAASTTCCCWRSSSGASPPTTSTSRRSGRARSTKEQIRRELKGMAGKARDADRQGLHRLPRALGLLGLVVDGALASLGVERETPEPASPRASAPRRRRAGACSASSRAPRRRSCASSSSAAPSARRSAAR